MIILLFPFFYDTAICMCLHVYVCTVSQAARVCDIIMCTVGYAKTLRKCEVRPVERLYNGSYMLCSVLHEQSDEGARG